MTASAEVCAQNAALPATRRWQREDWHKLQDARDEAPLSRLSPLTLVSSYSCTQHDIKTNWDKLASSGLGLEWTTDSVFSSPTSSSSYPPSAFDGTCFLHDYGRNLTTHWFKLSLQSAPPGHFLWPTEWSSPIFTAGVFPQVLHM